MQYCDVCGNESDEIKHLPLYVFGSEGINTCLQCRIILTEVAKGIRNSCTKAKKQGYIMGKNKRRKLL